MVLPVLYFCSDPGFITEKFLLLFFVCNTNIVLKTNRNHLTFQYIIDCWGTHNLFL